MQMTRSGNVEEAAELIMIVNRPEGAAAQGEVEDCLILPFEQRQKARQRVRLQSGREAALFLPRGAILRHGDVLVSEDGMHIRVEADGEQVTIARTGDVLLLARIAYHLGNRHVPVQILPDRLVYRHDHVLDDMVRGLGGAVEVASQPFEPEEGAYHGGGHAHSH